MGKLAGKAFCAGGCSRAEPPVVVFTDPETVGARHKITLVDRPGAASADVFVGALGPSAHTKSLVPRLRGGGRDPRRPPPGHLAERTSW